MWVATEAVCDTTQITELRDLETIRPEEQYVEGQWTTRLVSDFERQPDLRSAGWRCIAPAGRSAV